MPLGKVVGLGPGDIVLDGDGRRREGVRQIFFTASGRPCPAPLWRFCHFGIATQLTSIKTYLSTY